MTDLVELRTRWTEIGDVDALFGVLTQPDKSNNRWELPEFTATGQADVGSLLRLIEANQVPLRRRRALDFGCGVGRLTQPLCEEFEEVHGVDIATTMLRIARENNHHGDRCVYHEMPPTTRIPLADGQFDFICSLITLQHMQPEYASGIIADFARLLASGGVALFQVPLAQPTRRRRRWLIPIENRMRRFGKRMRGTSQKRGGRTVLPKMEMHCVPESEVRRIPAESGMHLAAVVQDDAATDDCISNRYLSVRQNQRDANA